MPRIIHPFVENPDNADFAVFQYPIEDDMPPRTKTTIACAYFIVRTPNGIGAICYMLKGLDEVLIINTRLLFRPSINRIIPNLDYVF